MKVKEIFQVVKAIKAGHLNAHKKFMALPFEAQEKVIDLCKKTNVKIEWTIARG